MFFRRSATGYYLPIKDNRPAADLLTVQFNPNPGPFHLWGSSSPEVGTNTSTAAGPANMYLVNNQGKTQNWGDTFVEIDIASLLWYQNFCGGGGPNVGTNGIVSCGMAARCSGTYPAILGYYCKLSASGGGFSTGGVDNVVTSASWETGIYEGSDGFGHIARGVQASGSLSSYVGSWRFEVVGTRPTTLNLYHIVGGSPLLISSTTHDWGSALSNATATGAAGYDGGNAADGNGGSIPSSSVTWIPDGAGPLNPAMPVSQQRQGSGYYYQDR